MYGAETVALTINTAKMDQKDARDYATQYEKDLGIPCILPLEDGVEPLIPIFKKMIEEAKK
ncbi:MAG: DUF1611 domain-containing protein [Cyclobacteriaceae bacterium]|nr:DUF1611 domain-containing protein [Cyclobacteriaceae bacterium]